MNVAFIPVRGGSKSIPLKNVKLINGEPLVFWALLAACDCRFIDKVYVSTDSDIISETVNNIRNSYNIISFSKIEIVDRTPQTATDTASTESAMLEFAYKYNFDNIVLIQATSPLIKSEDLDKGFELFNDNETDSVLSVVRQKRFQWEKDENGVAKPVNYDVYKRPRRQEFEGYFVENGAFYITSKNDLLTSKNRISGNIKMVEMDPDTFYEIDEPDDWNVIETLMRTKYNNLTNAENEIKMFLTDCDGCLTDAGMYYSEMGDELKKFNTRDGMGFALLKERNIITGMITSENVELNKRRAEKLGLDEYIPKCMDKVAAIKMLCNKYNIEMNNVCYIGDDLNDLLAIKTVGLGCCPADATKKVKEVAKYIAKKNGGDGVIREIVEYILLRK